MNFRSTLAASLIAASLLAAGTATAASASAAPSSVATAAASTRTMFATPAKIAKLTLQPNVQTFGSVEPLRTTAWGTTFTGADFTSDQWSKEDSNEISFGLGGHEFTISDLKFSGGKASGWLLGTDSYLPEGRINLAQAESTVTWDGDHATVTVPQGQFNYETWVFEFTMQSQR